MTRARAAAAALLIALIAALAALPPAASSLPLARQAATPEPPIEIGAGPIGDRAFAITGRSLYQPDGARLYGYLTAAIGLTAAQLFTGAPSERTARFTYVGTASRAGGGDRGDVTTFDGDGPLRVYFNDGAGATWGDPASFARGTLVAEFTLRLRDTQQRQAPGVGVVVGDEQLTQTAGDPFAIDGQPYRFGAVGIDQRLRSVGALVSGAPQGSLLVALTGSSSVTQRPAIAVQLEASPPPVMPATLAAGSCAPLQPWLGQTQDRLARAKKLAASAPPNADVAALDAASLNQAAAAADDLATAQRQAAAPAAAVDANRLALTALSTDARALHVIATAAANRDATLLAQGRQILLDGEQLRGRAGTTLDDLERACPAGGASPAATP